MTTDFTNIDLYLDVPPAQRDGPAAVMVRRIMEAADSFRATLPPPADGMLWEVTFLPPQQVEERYVMKLQAQQRPIYPVIVSGVRSVTP